MKENIATLAVWDAFRNPSECPLCSLLEKAEEKYVEFYLVNIMQPEARIAIEKTGYCKHHIRLLYQRRDLLPLAIQLNDILTIRIKEREKMFRNLIISAEDAGENNKKKGFIFFNKQEMQKESTCLICDALDKDRDINRRITIELWKKHDDFKELFKSSRGFCMKHEVDLIKTAKKRLSGKLFKDFTSVMDDIQKKEYKRIKEELEYFIDQYDYQNANRPWKTSRDAVPRVIRKIMGNAIVPEIKPKGPGE
ncbi:DUF6062 family protein [Spirochaetia bacterium 38H-sp]|uniref:DUF6062 family protein n=1 Tax=Rarispira pelagica TaxID=3141764 RepID=A0ABU9U916_9SPIR